MNPKTIPFVIGALCGFAAALVFERYFTQADPVRFEPQERAAVAEPVEEDPMENRSGRRIAELESELLRLQSELDAALSGSELQGAAAMRPMDPEQMREQMLPHLRRMVDQMVMKYQGRLELAPDQQQKLHALLLLKQERMHAALATRIWKEGELSSSEEMISNQEVMELARDFMSEQQLAAFEQVQQEERRAQSEMIATARLGQIAPMLGLSETQKDAVYGLYYSEAAKREEGVFRGPTIESSEELDAALGEILTPEQMEQYREFERTQRQNGLMILRRG